MDFSVEPDVFARFPGMRLAVVVARDVDNQRDRSPIAHGWAEAWEAAARTAAPFQARDGLIHPETRSVFLVSESLPEAGAGLAEAVLDELTTGLGENFSAASRSFVVDAATPRISW